MGAFLTRLFGSGEGFKRWIALAVFGVFLLLAGFSLLFTFSALGAFHELAMRALGFGGPTLAKTVLTGSTFVVVALFILLLAGFRLAQSSEQVEGKTAFSGLRRGPHIVVIGGGTGLSQLLRGLKHHTAHLTAIVTVTDDGGSSGRLRRDMAALPPGDIRNCLVALAQDESLMGRLFQHRFSEGELAGHSFGNLYLTALAQVTGSFDEAVRVSSHVLAVRGQVLPSSLDQVTLHARLENGSVVDGESAITVSTGPPSEIWLEPRKAKAFPPALEALRSADLIVLGPGSLYTSILPNLLLDEIGHTLAEVHAKKIYVCNVMTEPGETDSYSASDHVNALKRHLPSLSLDGILISNTPVPAPLRERYFKSGAEPVEMDSQALHGEVSQVIVGDFACAGETFQHDPSRLAQCLIGLLKKKPHE